MARPGWAGNGPCTCWCPTVPGEHPNVPVLVGALGGRGDSSRRAARVLPYAVGSCGPVRLLAATAAVWTLTSACCWPVRASSNATSLVSSSGPSICAPAPGPDGHRPPRCRESSSARALVNFDAASSSPLRRGVRVVGQGVSYPSARQAPTRRFFCAVSTLPPRGPRRLRPHLMPLRAHLVGHVHPEALASHGWIHHLVVRGCLSAVAITFPLVFGWVHFRSAPDDHFTYVPYLFASRRLLPDPHPRVVAAFHGLDRRRHCARVISLALWRRMREKSRRAWRCRSSPRPAASGEAFAISFPGSA